MLAQYADDVAIWTTDADPKVAERRVNKALQKIADWTANWRIKIAPEKSVFILFSRRPTHRRQNIKLSLQWGSWNDRLNWRQQFSIHKRSGFWLEKISILRVLKKKMDTSQFFAQGT